MAIIDDKTGGREYPLPNAANKLKDDVVRLRSQGAAIDADVVAVLAGLAGKAPAVHTHAVSDVTGLQAALAAKQDVGQHDALDDLSDVSVTGAANGQVLIKQGASWIPIALQVGNITNLETLLGDKAGATATADALALKAPLASPALTGTPTAPTATVGTNTTQLATTAFVQATFVDVNKGMFIKADHTAVAFTKTAAGTADVKAGTFVEVAGALYKFAIATAITMPALVSGTDYAIWIKPDGTVQATTDHVSPPVANSRKIGGFHYAAGGNAAARTGGNTTPQINEYSFWDLRFRPACPDPRGMTLVAGSFWADIYLLGVDHHTNGSSRYNVTIADGSSPPKVPTVFGGNGSATYGTLNWWEAAEVLQSHGKRLLDYAEFAAAAYGTTEATSGTTDPVSTILRAAFTSKWGIMLATGNLWVWGRDFGGSFGTAAYTPNGRGSTYMLSNAAFFGGNWAIGADSGSRASGWSNLPSGSSVGIGARGCCDHLTHA